MILDGCVLETLYGNLRTPDWKDDLIVRSLNQLGEWSGVETALASCLINPGEILWDVGAFLGTFSLGVSLDVELGRVLAIEANPDLHPFLSHNVKSKVANADVLSCGVGPKTGWLEADAEVLDNHGSASYVFRNSSPTEGRNAIQCDTLFRLRREYGDYDIIKLDIEGMERETLLGDLDFLKARQPVIWAECNEDLASIELLGALKWLGYDVLYVAFPAFRKANFNQSPDLIYPLAYEASLIAAPQNRLSALKQNAQKKAVNEDIILRDLNNGFDLRKALFDTPRWSRRDWSALSRAELIARLGRQEKNQELSLFLTSETAI